MNYNHLYYFNTVASVGNVTQAAKLLYISQPSLSYAISQLEKELGYRLFTREGRKIVLSSYGQKLYEYTKDAFELLQNGIEESHHLAFSNGGHIRIACINTISGDYLPKIMHTYLQEYPKTTFEVKNTSTLSVIELLKSEKADIGFCTEVKDDTLSFTPLFSQPFVVIVPTNHPLANRRKVSLKEVMIYPLIGYTASLPIAKSVEQIFHDEQLEPIFSFRHDDEILIGGMVMQGFGIGVVAKTPFLKQFPLCEVPLDIPNQNLRQIHLAYAKNHFQSHSEKLLIDLIISHIKKE